MKNSAPPSPPKWADYFLKLYCNPALLEQIQGDAYELFFWRIEENGQKYAKRAYIWDVIRFFRWKNIKRSKTQIKLNNMFTLFNNYLKIGLRNILKQRSSSFINIFGLSCAIACCFVAYLFISSIWLRGIHNENRAEIYMLTHTSMDAQKEKQYGTISSPIGSLMNEQSAGIKTVSINSNSGVIKHRGETFSEGIQYVNPEFMEVFTYNVLYGNPYALVNPNEIIITEKLAIKLFNISYPVGKTLEVIVKGGPQLFTVGAILENLPSTAFFHFDLLVNRVHLENPNATLEDQWSQNNWLFIQTDQPNILIDGFKLLTNTHNEIIPDEPYIDLQLEPLTTIMQKTHDIEGGVGSYGSMAPTILLALIALFMLSLAVLNYVNIALYMAMKRVKEIGVRKAIGGRRDQLIVQFLSENLITCFFAFVIGGIMATTIFLPGFNTITSNNLKLDLFGDFYLFGFSVILIVFISLISGAYPAFYISSFNAVHIFRGSYKMKNKSVLTSGLLVFQFVLSIVTIVAGIAFIQTNLIIQTRDWGYDNTNKIVVNVDNEENYNALNNRLLQYTDVKNTAGSQHIFGERIEESSMTYNNEVHELHLVNASSNFGEVMGFRLKQGRLLDTELVSDSSSVVVNQTFLDWLDLSFPLDHPILVDSIQFEVVGVVEDFHYNHFAFTVVPAAIRLAPKKSFNYMTVQVTPGTAEAMETIIKKEWHNEIKDSYYQGCSLATVFDPFFDDIQGVGYVLLFTATLAIILTAMGLYGLISLNITAKLKELGIRKVLGASMAQLSKNISIKFLIIYMVGCGVGIALSYLAISALLDMVYAYHPGLRILPFSVAVTVLLSVIVLTIYTQMRRVRKMNPVETIRIE